MVFYVYLYHIILVIAAHPHSRAYIYSAPGQLFLSRAVNYCPLLLGGYGARTRGVYQHLTLNGTILYFVLPTVVDAVS